MLCLQSFAATVSADARGIASEAKGKLSSKDEDQEVRALCMHHALSLADLSSPLQCV